MYTKLVFRRRDWKLLGDEADKFMKVASEVFKGEWDFRHRSPFLSPFNQIVDHIIAIIILKIKSYVESFKNVRI